MRATKMVARPQRTPAHPNIPSARRSRRRFLGRPPRRPALLDRRARRTAAVVAPAGLAPHIAELVLPRRRPHILRDPDPFMHRGPQYIEAADRKSTRLNSSH